MVIEITNIPDDLLKMLWGRAINAGIKLGDRINRSEHITIDMSADSNQDPRTINKIVDIIVVSMSFHCAYSPKIGKDD